MNHSFDPDTLAVPKGHFIDGRYVDADGDVLGVTRPSDGQACAGITIADAEIVDGAVQAAKRAQRDSGWASCRPRDRVRVMHKWADLIEQNGTRLARLEAFCSTRPITPTAEIEVRNAAEHIRFFAEMADKEGGATVPTSEDLLGMILTEPYGVIGAITPWNFPISMATWKMAPAIAAGNGVVIKPSEMTPFSTLYLAELAVEAGLPKGLINVVLGDGPTTGHEITGHPDIAKISFTGSIRAGQAIMTRIAATGMKPMTLELGGKSPQLVFADADLDLAAASIAGSIMSNAGQVCNAGSRVLVDKQIRDALLERLIPLMTSEKSGPTWDARTEYSPIISNKQRMYIDNIVRQAAEGGAEVLTGGKPVGGPGFFYEPTVLSSLDPQSPALSNEIFGPVLTVQTFENEDEALTLGNDSAYGLAAGVFTSDLGRGLRMSKALQAGNIWVNRYGRSGDHILPTGGYKHSGIGKDLGKEAYGANRQSKSVLIGL